MTTMTDIERALCSVLRPEARFVVMHSHIGAFGQLINPVESVLSAIERSLAHCTIAMPTFTFSFCRTGIYHWRDVSSEVGILGEHFRKQSRVLRTRHPIYSFAVRGPLADRLATCAGHTCWGEDTPFALMEEEDADILMLGCDWSTCTLFHRAEELTAVPYRYEKIFSGHADYGVGRQAVTASFFVRSRECAAENNFDRLIAALRERKMIRTVTVERARIEAASARDIMSVARELLQQDPFAFVSNVEHVRATLAQWRVAICGSANVSVFAEYFRKEFSSYIPEGCRIFLPPFDQYRQQLLQSDSDLRAFDPQYILFLELAEEVLGPLLANPATVADTPEIMEKMVRERVNDYVEILKLARGQMRATLLICNFDAPAASPLFLADAASPHGQQHIIAAANACLLQAVENIPDAWIIDFAHIRSAFGRMASADHRFWYIARIPFSRDFSRFLSRRLVGVLLALAGRTARVLVLDLDQTLWGGVIGDDGMEGIQLGGDFPGNVFADFQRTLVAISQRGIALAICSKNSESIAMAAITRHPHMVLREKHFVARRINWSDKASNMLELAEELSVGLNAMCFIDDNPIERELIRCALPQVIVPELPPDPTQYATFLLNLPWLETLNVTIEDRKRVAQYHARSKVEHHRSQFHTLEDFYQDLNMELYFENYDKGNQARTLQLLAKTNQFNATTRRYSEADLSALQRSGAVICPIGLKDRFTTEKEIIGVIIVRWPYDGQSGAVIDSFLLSCRVLGRSVESGVLGWVAVQAQNHKVCVLEGLIIPTERNQPVRSVYVNHGFREIEVGRYQLDVQRCTVQMPPWFVVHEGASHYG